MSIYCGTYETDRRHTRPDIMLSSDLRHPTQLAVSYGTCRTKPIHILRVVSLPMCRSEHNFTRRRVNGYSLRMVGGRRHRDTRKADERWNAVPPCEGKIAGLLSIPARQTYHLKLHCDLPAVSIELAIQWGTLCAGATASMLRRSTNAVSQACSDAKQRAYSTT